MLATLDMNNNDNDNNRQHRLGDSNAGCTTLGQRGAGEVQFVLLRRPRSFGGSGGDGGDDGADDFDDHR